MDKSITLTKPVFESLVEHLIYIEESGDRLAAFYFPDLPEDREDMKRTFKQYIKAVEEELEHVTVVKSFKDACCLDCLNTFPFVVIGSEVELETVSNKAVHVYRLIHPDGQIKADNGITYLSSFGKALLLKQTGSEIDMDTSAGLQRSKIKKVKLLA